MYSYEREKEAVGLYIKFEKSAYALGIQLKECSSYDIGNTLSMETCTRSLDHKKDIRQSKKHNRRQMLRDTEEGLSVWPRLLAILAANFLVNGATKILLVSASL